MAKFKDVKTFNEGYVSYWDEMPNEAFNAFKVNNGKNHLNLNLFGKTFYMVYERSVRQFKILKGYLFFGNTGYVKPNSGMRGTSSDNMYLIEIAGVGKRLVHESYSARLPFSFYESVEDYKANKPIEGDDNYPRIPFLELREVVGNEFYCDFNKSFQPVRWKWDGALATPFLVSLPLYLEYDADGFRAPIWEDKGDGYQTREECEEDNELTIVTFDGEEPSIEKKEKVVVLGIHLELTESDIKKLKDVVMDYL